MHASRDKKKTHAATPGVEVKALVKTLADRLAEVKAKTVSDTLAHVEAYSLVNKFATRQAEMKAKTIDGTVRDFQAQALVHTTADTLLEVRARIMPTYCAMVKRGLSGGRGTSRRAWLHASRNEANKNWRHIGRCKRHRLHDTIVKSGHTCRHTLVDV